MLMCSGMFDNPADALKFAYRQRVRKPDPASITTNPSHDTHGFDPFDADQHSRTDARRFVKLQTAAGSDRSSSTIPASISVASRAILRLPNLPKGLGFIIAYWIASWR